MIRGIIGALRDRRTDYFSYYALVHHYTVLGERDRALDALERAYENHDFMLPFVNVDPLYDDLHDEPRVRAVFRRMGLAS